MFKAVVFSVISAIAIACAGQGRAQSGGAAGIDQIPATRSARQVGVQAIDRTRSSATVQSAAADKVPALVSPEVLAACQKALAADQPAPKGVDCVRALQVTSVKNEPSAESSLLPLFGQNSTVTTQSSADASGSVNAEQVSRQLSSGDFQGTSGSDAAASVARDRQPPPQAAPPPR